jgi:hypothetical protein
MTDDQRHRDRPHERQSDDPGAYIGREPERSTETIPGGIGPDDERVAAHSTQTGGGEERDVPPAGHRQSDRVSDDDIREAGDRR